MPMADSLTTARALASLATSLLRIDRGLIVKGNRCRPEKTLELYEAEYCPYCRHVREALTELDLDAMIYPVPKEAKRYVPRLKKLGGEAKVPFLHDPNTGTKLYDSDAIVEYLYEQYGMEGEDVPKRRIVTSTLASLTRAGSVTSLSAGKNGMLAKPSKAASKPLELYSFEASPYSRLAREVLCELEVKYLLHNCGKTPGGHSDYYPPEYRHENMHNYMPGTENRRKFLERTGKIMMPYIVDPNTGVDMYQTKDIQEYLRETYGA
jgi:glutathione S-transferase